MSVSSPTLKPTRAAMDRMLEEDYRAAAILSTRKQRDIEAKANANNQTVSEYLRTTGASVSTDYRARGALDPMEADYMRAAQLATANQRELEAKAWEQNLTVDKFMQKHGIFTWALGDSQ